MTAAGTARWCISVPHGCRSHDLIATSSAVAKDARVLVENSQVDLVITHPIRRVGGTPVDLWLNYVLTKSD